MKSFQNINNRFWLIATVLHMDSSHLVMREREFTPKRSQLQGAMHSKRQERLQPFTYNNAGHVASKRGRYLQKPIETT